MNITSHRWALFFSAGALCLVLGTFSTFSPQSTPLSANILTAEESSFYLWYIENSIGSQQWTIPTQRGTLVELPLGISVNGNSFNAQPIDSVEFRINGIPDYLSFESPSTFPGFHVDVMQTPSDVMGTYNLSVFLTPEFFTENTGGTPGAPTDSNEIGQLMSATDEILRLQFRVVSAVHRVSPLSVEAIVTARDGDFTRYVADGNQTFPGDNPGTIEIVPDTLGASLQIVTTRALDPKTVYLEFTNTLLPGTGENGSENPLNYYIYSCDSHVPAPIAADANASDVQSCQLKQQESIPDPGEAFSAVRESEHPYAVRVQLPNGKAFDSDAFYIVRVENVANDTAEISIPADGVYSQMFQWKAHPLVQEITPVDAEHITVRFTAGVCPATSPLGMENISNYALFACNAQTDIPECAGTNTSDLPNPSIVSVTRVSNTEVSLGVASYTQGAHYVLQLQNIANENCEDDSRIPVSPPYYVPLSSGSSTPPSAGTGNTDVRIGVGSVHLPWREILPLRPLGGNPPFSWTVVPAEAGIIDTTNPQEPVFRPALVDGNGNPIHDERDVVLRVTDADGKVSELQVHILRRGDLGGTTPVFLDKTDIQDVNDVSAGWKR